MCTDYSRIYQNLGTLELLKGQLINMSQFPFTLHIFLNDVGMEGDLLNIIRNTEQLSD